MTKRNSKRRRRVSSHDELDGVHFLVAMLALSFVAVFVAAGFGWIN